MAQFDQRAIHRARFLDVEKSLLFEAVGGGLKKNVDPETVEPVDRISFDKHAISDAIEFDGAADWCVHHLRMPDDGHLVTADARQDVEGPFNRRWWRGLRRQAGGQCEYDSKGKQAHGWSG